MGRNNKTKITATTHDEFVTEVATDCYKKLSADDKDYIRQHPESIHYHMGYCMDIRNNYIYNNYDRLEFAAEPDELSGTIMDLIIDMVLNESNSD